MYLIDFCKIYRLTADLLTLDTHTRRRFYLSILCLHKKPIHIIMQLIHSHKNAMFIGEILLKIMETRGKTV